MRSLAWAPEPNSSKRTSNCDAAKRQIAVTGLFCQNHAGCRRLCCCHECDSPWPIPVQQFLDHVRMPWIPSDQFSCHVVLCTSICSLLVVRCTSHAEASKQLALEHRCQPCQPCQSCRDPVDLRNSHANKGRKLSAPNNHPLFGLSGAASEHTVPSKCRFFRLPVITLTSLSAPAPPRKPTLNRRP